MAPKRPDTMADTVIAKCVQNRKLNALFPLLVLVLVYQVRWRLFFYHQLQVAQLSQRDRAAGWVSNGQKWKTGTERQYLQTI